MAETNKGIYYPTFAEVGEETYDGPVKMKMMAESIDPLLLSDEDKTKLDNIEAGAEVNVIESVKVNGTALTITDKAVDVPVPTKTSDLTNDSSFGTYSKPNGGIPSTDLSSAVQTSLGKADTAVQDVSGKEDKSNKVTSISSSSTNAQYPSAKLLYDKLAEKQEQIDALVEENSTLKKQQLKGQASGSIIQLTDSAEGLEIENVTLKGTMSQETREGYNLLKFDKLVNDQKTYTIGGITATLDDDCNLTFNGTQTSSWIIFYEQNITSQLKNGTTYTLWCENYSKNLYSESAYGQIRCVNKSTSAETYIVLNQHKITFTADTAQFNYIFFVQMSNNNLTLSNEKNRFMIYEGIEEKTFEKYGATPSIEFESQEHGVTGNCNVKAQNSDASLQQTVPLALGNIKLYDGDKIQISYINQTGYKKVTGANRVSNMAKYTFTGNEPIYIDTISDLYYFALTNYMPNIKINIKLSSYNISNMYSNRYIKGTQLNTQTNAGMFSASQWGNDEKYMYFNKGEFATNTELKNYFEANETYCIYELESPTITPITDTTLLNQLETLINMKTYKQITNIETTGSDLAPVLEFQYSKDLQTVIDNMQAQILS